MAKWTSPEYNQILTEHLQTFKKSGQKKQTEIVKEIKGLIRDVANKNHSVPPDNLNQVILKDIFLFHHVTCFYCRKYAIGCATIDEL